MFLSGDQIEALWPSDDSRLSISLSLHPLGLKCRVRVKVSNLLGEELGLGLIKVRAGVKIGVRGKVGTGLWLWLWLG